jgi:hypothetical protein
MPNDTPSETVAKSIEQLKNSAAWWEQRARNLEDRVAELEGKKTDAESDRRERDAKFERKAQAELQHARAAAIRALVKLLPEAIKQAKAKPPRPALLRMILRATR